MSATVKASARTGMSWLVTPVVACKYFILLATSPKRRLVNGFNFLHATEGRSFDRAYRTFAQSPVGSELLRTQPATAELLSDRAKLASAPPGSLGRCYEDFLTRHGFHGGVYLRSIEALSLSVDSGEREWFRLRCDSTHDLRHVLTGYGPDPLGEICLLSFRFGQTRHIGTLILAILGLLQAHAGGRAKAARAALEAYRRGRDAMLLDLLPWETRFDRSLAEYREQVGLSAPRNYPGGEFPDAYTTVAGLRP